MAELEAELEEVKESWRQDRSSSQGTIRRHVVELSRLEGELEKAQRLSAERQDTVHSLLKALQELAVKAETADQALTLLRQQAVQVEREKTQLSARVLTLETQLKRARVQQQDIRILQSELSYSRARIGRLEMELEVARAMGSRAHPSSQPSLARADFRLLAALVHPDAHPEERKEKAERAMKLVNGWRQP